MKRRSFFGLLAGGVAALRTDPFSTPALAAERLNGSVTATPALQAKLPMERYTSDAFASRVGQLFSFQPSADPNEPPIHLELVDVHRSPHRAAASMREPFSLLFALRRGDSTQESTLHVRHDELEPCAWFVNRVVAPEHDTRTAYYEAVFG